MGTSAVGDGTVRECAIITLDNCDELAHCLECDIIKMLISTSSHLFNFCITSV